MKILEYSDGILIHGDNLEWLKSQPADSIDLIFGSPPYETQRTYRELNFNLKGQSWVDWMVSLWNEMDRVCKGLVAMVVEGPTKDFRWSASPALLMADLHRAGFRLRKPCVYKRCGIPGTGGEDWLRADYEWIICTSKGKLPWSDNTIMGHPPKFPPGGDTTHRTKDGERVDAKREAIRPPLVDGTIEEKKWYGQPEIANPGNVIGEEISLDELFEQFVKWMSLSSEIVDCGAVGGGNVGCKIAHEGDAPFPEYLAEFFIRSFCPKSGKVLDPFAGSGTTLSVARMFRRQFVGIDIRESEIEKCTRRLKNGAIRQGLDV